MVLWKWIVQFSLKSERSALWIPLILKSRQIGSNVKAVPIKKQNVAIIVPAGSCPNVLLDQAGGSIANVNSPKSLPAGIDACITGTQSMATVTA
jgi:hypothetical protein